MVRRGLRYLGRAVLLHTILAGGLRKAVCQPDVRRTVEAMAAAASGSEIVMAINDYGDDVAPRVFAFSVFDGHLLWRGDTVTDVHALAFSPDGRTIAIGVDRIPDFEAVTQLVDAATGKTSHEIKQNESLDFFPNQAKALAFAPNGLLLYGLTEDGLFAWDVQVASPLWRRNLPGGDPVVRWDTANSFALSADGSRLAFNRWGTTYVLRVGRTQPRAAIKLPGDINNIFDQPAFSPDGQFLVTGSGENTSFGVAAHHAGLLWRLDGSKPVPIQNCGGHFAWTSDPLIFACENSAGTHLRSVRDPQKDLGVAGPVSDLPFLKVGNSVWAAAYRIQDWKDPAKPLPLTLVEMGTGRQVTIMVPGRTASTIGAN